MINDDIARLADELKLAASAPDGPRRIEAIAAKLRSLAQPPVSDTTAALIDLLRQRDAAGRAKYGATLDRTDLTHAQWLQHMVEELLDGAGYALAALRESTARSAPPARPLDEWHEDYGFSVWWTWRDGEWLGEPSYIGSPLCSDWPGYHTHFTPHPEFPPPALGGAA